jgi:hypothetical protein
MLAVTRSLLERGDVAVVVEDGAPVVALRPGRDGNVYSPYGILPSLLAIPLHLLGTIIAHTGSSADYASRFTVTMLNGLLTAATCAVIARWAQQLGATIGWSLVLALIYGLSTFAWVYARTFFSEPLAALLLLSATYYAWSAFQSSRTNYWQLFVSGLLRVATCDANCCCGCTADHRSVHSLGIIERLAAIPFTVANVRGCGTTMAHSA